MSEMQISEKKLKRMETMFKVTAVTALTTGPAVMFTPKLIQKLLGVKKEQDQVFFGLMGAVYIAFGICSCFGIRNPRKWAPILMLQFLYKSTWELGVIGYMAMKGELEFKEYALMIIGYIVVFIVPDLWAVPFKELLAND